MGYKINSIFIRVLLCTPSNIMVIIITIIISDTAMTSPHIIIIINTTISITSININIPKTVNFLITSLILKLR